jgi:hypothetical protein
MSTPLDALIHFATAKPPAPPAPAPSAVTPARSAALPPEDRQPQLPVRPTHIVGQVAVRRAGSSHWEDLDSDDVLGLGDTVRTGHGDSVQLRFADGTVLAVKANSKLKVEGTPPPPVEHGTLAPALSGLVSSPDSPTEDVSPLLRQLLGVMPMGPSGGGMP